MRTYYLRSFGCQMNEHDAERIRPPSRARDSPPSRRPDEADVLVYNTCTVRRSADERLAGHLGEAARLKREDPARIVLVTGCLPQAEQEGFFARFPFVDGALGPQNLHRLPELLQAAVEPAGAAGGPSGRPGFFDDGPALSGDLPGRRARPLPGLGADHVGLHQLLLVLHRAVRARAGAQPRGRRHPRRRARRSPPTASARSRCSDRTSTRTVSTCAAPVRRTPPTSPRCCARSTRRAASPASAS